MCASPNQTQDMFQIKNRNRVSSMTLTKCKVPDRVHTEPSRVVCTVREHMLAYMDACIPLYSRARLNTDWHRGARSIAVFDKNECDGPLSRRGLLRYLLRYSGEGLGSDSGDIRPGKFFRSTEGYHCRWRYSCVTLDRPSMPFQSHVRNLVIVFL